MAVLYYAGMFYRYGKFEKKMRRKPGGKGYWKDPGDGEKKCGERGRGEEQKEMEKVVVDHGSVEKDGVDTHTVRWSDDTLLNVGGEERTQQDVVQRPAPTASLQSKTFTREGLTSVWGVKDKFKSGCDGQKARGNAWDIDMTEESK